MSFPPPTPGPFGSGAQGPFGPPPGGGAGPVFGAGSPPPVSLGANAPPAAVGASPAGPFGPGGTGFPPPGGTPGLGFGGPVVVHRARLGVRLLVVGLVMLVSFGVTAAVVWFAVFSRDDSGSDRVAGTTSVAVGRPGSSTGVALPTGWPETFAPPSGARVISAVATSAGTPEEQFVVVYEVPGELSAVAGVMRGQLVGSGFTITNDSAGEIDQPTSLIATGGGKDAIVSVAPTPARPEVATVTWILRPTS